MRNLYRLTIQLIIVISVIAIPDTEALSSNQTDSAYTTQPKTVYSRPPVKESISFDDLGIKVKNLKLSKNKLNDLTNADASFSGWLTEKVFVAHFTDKSEYFYHETDMQKDICQITIPRKNGAMVINTPDYFSMNFLYKAAKENRCQKTDIDKSFSPKFPEYPESYIFLIPHNERTSKSSDIIDDGRLVWRKGKYYFSIIDKGKSRCVEEIGRELSELRSNLVAKKPTLLKCIAATEVPGITSRLIAEEDIKEVIKNAPPHFIHSGNVSFTSGYQFYYPDRQFIYLKNHNGGFCEISVIFSELTPQLLKWASVDGVAQKIRNHKACDDQKMRYDAIDDYLKLLSYGNRPAIKDEDFIPLTQTEMSDDEGNLVSFGVFKFRTGARNYEIYNAMIAALNKNPTFKNPTLLAYSDFHKRPYITELEYSFGATTKALYVTLDNGETVIGQIMTAERIGRIRPYEDLYCLAIPHSKAPLPTSSSFWRYCGEQFHEFRKNLTE